MIGRRELLLGGIMLAGLAMGEGLRPRRALRLMPAGGLKAIVPQTLGTWQTEAGGDFILPRREGGVADRLYGDDVLSRVYRNDAGQHVMLLIAYGAAQSDLLQLHRPESCYPAVGFAASAPQLLDVAAGAARIPAVFLTATRGSRVEDVLYFARLGEYLPQSAGAQREARLRTAMDGLVGDGVLVRASIIRQDESESGRTVLQGFMAAMLGALAPDARRGLVGSGRAARISTSK
jgi:EpsI family protein